MLNLAPQNYTKAHHLEIEKFKFSRTGVVPPPQIPQTPTPAGRRTLPPCTQPPRRPWYLDYPAVGPRRAPLTHFKIASAATAVVSGNMRFMQIFTGVPWRRDVKRQWGNRKPTLLYSIIQSLVAFPLTPICMTLNDTEWPFYVKFSLLRTAI